MGTHFQCTVICMKYLRSKSALNKLFMEYLNYIYFVYLQYASVQALLDYSVYGSLLDIKLISQSLIMSPNSQIEKQKS